MNHRALDETLVESLKNFPKEQVMAHYPRRIITPLDYLNPKYFSLINFLFINDIDPLNDAPDLVKRRVARQLFSQVLVERFVPTYFLDEAFLDAVDQTEMLDSFTFAQLYFPMPGFLLVLPCEWIKSKVGVHIPFLIISTLNGFLHISQDIVGDDGNLQFVANSLPYDKVSDTISSTIKLRKNLTFTQEEASTNMAVIDNSGGPASDKRAIYIVELVLKLLVILSTQPNTLVDPPAKQARPQRVRKNGVIKTDALWHPCFIGKSVQQRAHRNGFGPAMRMHWRRGHLRNQRCGQGRLVLKPVWIKPVLIHSELLEMERANQKRNVAFLNPLPIAPVGQERS